MNFYFKTLAAFFILLLPSLLQAKTDLQLPVDSGAVDVLQLRTGIWKEYKIDSTHKANIWLIDRHRKFAYDTADITITMNTGKYSGGHKTGVWKTFMCYSAQKPYKWILRENVNLTNGLFDGVWKYYASEGTILFEVQFKNGITDGVYKEYYNNGKVKAEKHFKENRLNGKQKTYFESGKIHREDIYVNGYLSGTSKMYYENGKIRYVRSYTNGYIQDESVHKSVSGRNLELGTLKNGTGTLNTYNEGGGLSTTYTYKYGRLDGKCSVYFKSGKLLRVTHFVNDTLNGIEEMYYENGTKQSESTIRKGKYDGSHKFWYPNGKLQGEYIYKKGLIWSAVSENDTTGKPLNTGSLSEGTGLLIGYDDSCRISYRRNFLKGHKNGENITYYHNGKVHYHNYYDNDTLIGMDSIFNELGFIIRSGNVTKGKWDGNIKSYYYNGKLKNVEWYKRGNYLNLISTMDMNGNIIDGGTIRNGMGMFKLISDSANSYSITEYQFGLRNGKSTGYLNGGTLTKELRFSNDTLDGIQKYYFPDGKLKFVYVMEMGKKFGSSIVYHQNGKPWTERIFYNDYLLDVKYNKDPNGADLNKGTVSDGNGTINQYDEEGKLIGTHEVINGYVPDWDKSDD